MKEITSPLYIPSSITRANEILFDQPAFVSSQHFSESQNVDQEKLIDDDFSVTEKVVFTVVLVALTLVGLVGNGLTISTALYRKLKLRTPANLFVLNLAIADFSIAVFSNTTHLVNMWSFFMFKSNIVCRLLASLCLLTCAESLLTLTAIAVFRYFGVNSNLQSLRKRRKFALSLIAMTWMISVTISLVSIFVKPNELFEPELRWCLYHFKTSGMAFVLPLLIASCLILVTFAYVSVIYRLVINELEQKRSFGTELRNPVPPEKCEKKGSITSDQSGPVSPNGLQSASKKRLLSLASTSSFPWPITRIPSTRSHLKVGPNLSMTSQSTTMSYNRFDMSKTIKTVLLLVVITYIVWLPNFAVRILAIYSIRVSRRMSMIALMLCHANSGANFIAYSVFNNFFRQSLVNFISTVFPKIRKRDRKVTSVADAKIVSPPAVARQATFKQTQANAIKRRRSLAIGTLHEDNKVEFFIEVPDIGKVNTFASARHRINGQRGLSKCNSSKSILIIAEK